MFLQGSSGGHMLLVEHSQCAEHGELVHRSEAHAHESHAPLMAEVSATVEAHDADANDSHEHCLLCADRRATVATSAGSMVIDIRMRDAAHAPRTVHELAGPPQHRTAPKNSPHA